MAMIVFVDKLTKMVHLARCKKEVTAMEYAQIFVDNVFRLHGLPEVIISDRDPLLHWQVLAIIVRLALVRISGSVLRFIRRPMVSQSR